MVLLSGAFLQYGADVALASARGCDQYLGVATQGRSSQEGDISAFHPLLSTNQARCSQSPCRQPRLINNPALDCKQHRRLYLVPATRYHHRRLSPSDVRPPARVYQLLLENSRTLIQEWRAHRAAKEKLFYRS